MTLLIQDVINYGETQFANGTKLDHENSDKLVVQFDLRWGGGWPEEAGRRGSGEGVSVQNGWWLVGEIAWDCHHRQGGQRLWWRLPVWWD
ncbi:hypothetical protein BUALT_Bualt13G0068000 [Buddleja alternifolia]|uniref:Uncharacterized protein n=1 Tax=Buddleja alternifolia TaxID=168488 RepID=A0AAV6WKK9_9LAMI|nr:hypothetical protein BUALT_Bualt13G0068000 [Buddleja alternifolia]